MLSKGPFPKPGVHQGNDITDLVKCKIPPDDTMFPMKIEPAKKDDKDVEKFGEVEWPIVDREHYGKAVDWDIEDFSFKATENGKVVGVVWGKLEAGVIFIDNLIVSSEERGKGIGKELMAEVESYAKKVGAHKIFLFTMEEWPASKFYEKLGYKMTGKLENHYLHKDFVIYSKFI